MCLAKQVMADPAYKGQIHMWPTDRWWKLNAAGSRHRHPGEPWTTPTALGDTS
jgi:hypothetical protein